MGDNMNRIANKILQKIALEIWNYPEHSFEEIVTKRTLFKYVIGNFFKTRQFTSTDKRPMAIYDEYINSDEFINFLNQNLFLNITDKVKFLQEMKEYLKSEYTLKNYFMNCIKNNSTYKFIMVSSNPSQNKEILKTDGKEIVQNKSNEKIITKNKSIPFINQVRELLKNNMELYRLIDLLLEQSKLPYSRDDINSMISNSFSDALLAHTNFQVKVFKHFKLKNIEEIKTFCKKMGDHPSDELITLTNKELNPTTNTYAWEGIKSVMKALAEKAGCASIPMNTWTRYIYKFMINYANSFVFNACRFAFGQLAVYLESESFAKKFEYWMSSKSQIIDGYDLDRKKDKKHTIHKLTHVLDQHARDYAFIIVDNQLIVGNIPGHGNGNVHINILRANLQSLKNISKIYQELNIFKNTDLRQSKYFNLVFRYLEQNAKLIFGIICNKSFIVLTRVNASFGYATNIIISKYPNVKVYDYHSNTEFERLAKRMR